MIMGTPIMGVMAFIGITPDDTGITLIKVHNNAMTAPHKAVAGSNMI